MLPIVWLHAARRNLAAILGFIAEHNPAPRVVLRASSRTRCCAMTALFASLPIVQSLEFSLHDHWWNSMLNLEFVVQSTAIN